MVGRKLVGAILVAVVVLFVSLSIADAADDEITLLAKIILAEAGSVGAYDEVGSAVLNYSWRHEITIRVQVVDKRRFSSYNLMDARDARGNLRYPWAHKVWHYDGVSQPAPYRWATARFVAEWLYYDAMVTTRATHFDGCDYPRVSWQRAEWFVERVGKDCFWEVPFRPQSSIGQIDDGEVKRWDSRLSR